jgi:hypothetical protein
LTKPNPDDWNVCTTNSKNIILGLGPSCACTSNAGWCKKLCSPNPAEPIDQLQKNCAGTFPANCDDLLTKCQTAP